MEVARREDAGQERERRDPEEVHDPVLHMDKKDDHCRNKQCRKYGKDRLRNGDRRDQKCIFKGAADRIHKVRLQRENVDRAHIEEDRDNKRDDAQDDRRALRRFAHETESEESQHTVREQDQPQDGGLFEILLERAEVLLRNVSFLAADHFQKDIVHRRKGGACRDDGNAKDQGIKTDNGDVADRAERADDGTACGKKTFQ